MKKIMSISVILAIGILVLSGVGIAANTSMYQTWENHPPDEPKITGSIRVKTGTNEWTFKAIDPDGDDVCYEISWGDDSREWTGWYISGEEITKNHTYPGPKNVVIGARAKDKHGAIGDWGHLMIEISKSKQIFNLLFFQFVVQFIEHFLMIK